jgi:phage terminase Nu1 subunit (DNA packaging protein)
MAALNEKSNQTYLVNGKQLAGIFSVTQRTIQNWVRDKGLPRVKTDRYDLAAVVSWRENLIRQEYAGGSSDGDRLLKAQADEREAIARRKVMEARRQEGELLERAEVESERLRRIMAVKSSLHLLGLTLGRRLAGVETEHEIEKIAEEEVEQCLLRFADAESVDEAGRALTEAIVGELQAAKVPAAAVKQIEARLGDGPWGLIGNRSMKLEARSQKKEVKSRKKKKQVSADDADGRR